MLSQLILLGSDSTLSTFDLLYLYLGVEERELKSIMSSRGENKERELKSITPSHQNKERESKSDNANSNCLVMCHLILAASSH